MIKKFIKTHEHAWVLVYFVFYMPWYFGLQQRDISHFFDMYVGLDRIIPFVPAFIIPYIYWFLFVAGTLLFLFFYDADEFYRGFSFLACGMTISLIIFTIFPTTFCHRPEVLTGNAFEQFWLRFIYGADKHLKIINQCIYLRLSQQYLLHYLQCSSNSIHVWMQQQQLSLHIYSIN